MSIRILLADDERLIRAGYRMILDSEPDLEVVGEAADGVEAVEAARRLPMCPACWRSSAWRAGARPSCSPTRPAW